MINFLVTMILAFKPVHMMQTPGHSCGAATRFLVEKVYVTVGDNAVKVGSTRWELNSKKDGYYLATYKAAPDAYMSMSLMFDEFDAYMTIQGIDENRKPCRDTVYLKRLR